MTNLYQQFSAGDGDAIRTLELDGDGRRDYLFGPYLTDPADPASIRWYAATGATDGTGPTLTDLGESPTLRGWSYGCQLNEIIGNTCQGDEYCPGVIGYSLRHRDNFHIADVTGDGRDDLIGGPDEAGRWQVAVSTGSSFLPPATWLTASYGDWLSEDELKAFTVGDVNGDGRQDIIFGPNGGDHWWVLVSEGDHFSKEEWYGASRVTADVDCTRVMDVNGDGRDDVVIPRDNGQWSVLLSEGGNFSYDANWIEGDVTAYSSWGKSTTCPRVRPSDFNGDGLEDIVIGPQGDGSWYVLQSTGRSFRDLGDVVRENGQHIGAFGAWDDNPERIYPSDVNGDGRGDFVIGPDDSGNWYVLESRGDHYERTGLWGGVKGQWLGGQFGGWDGRGGSRVRPMDLTGDGLTDVVLGPSDGSGAWSLVTPAGARPDLLVAVETGLGVRTAVEYAPLSAGGPTYERADDAVYPVRDLQGPAHVVTKRASPSGTGGTWETEYRYRGLKGHVTGGRSLGFGALETTDVTKGLVTISAYEQMRRPLVGALLSVEARLLSGDLIRRHAEAPEWVDLGGWRYLRYVESTQEESYEPGQSAPFSSRTTVSDPPDACGSSPSVAQTSSGGHVATTDTLAVYNPSSPFRCRPQTIRVSTSSTSPAPMAETATRTTETRFRSDGQVEAEVLEPGQGGDVTLTTSYDYYPAGSAWPGRLRGVTVTGQGLAARTTLIDAYDAFGFANQTTNAEGHVTALTTAPTHGGVLSVTDPNLLTVTSQFDGFGRAVRVAQADGTLADTATQWVAAGDVHAPPGALYRSWAQTSHPTLGALPEATSYFDLRGRLLRTVQRAGNGTWIYRDGEYDERGRLVADSRPYEQGRTPAGWTTYDFDELDRVRVVDPPGDEELTTDFNGLTTTVTNANGQSTTRVVDAAGQLVELVDADLGTTAYAYGPFGRLRRVTGPAGHVTELTYDARGRRASLSDPDTGLWTYRYFASGELLSQTDARQQTVTFSYDRLGRRTTRQTLPDNVTTTWTYDTAPGKGVGQLHRITSSDGLSEEAYVYDALGRPSRHEKTVAGTLYSVVTAYDAYGRIQTVTYPQTGFAVKRDYNAYGALEKVVNAATPSLAYWTADLANSTLDRDRVVLGNNVVSTKDYDPVTGRLLALRSGLNGGGELQQMAYGYDAVGNLLERSDDRQALTETFSYDALNRLVGAAGPYGSMRYDYDALGNLTYKSGVGRYRYDTSRPHAVTTVAGADETAIDYDPNGNPVQRLGDRATLDLAAETADQVVYVDGIYERVTTGALVEHKHYISGGSGLAAIYTKRSDGAESLVYVHTDPLGSIDALTTGAGVEVDRTSFDAWGQRRQPTNWATVNPASVWSLTSKGYTGHNQEDGAGLVHMGGRLYDPVLGRFLSPDTYVDGIDGQGLNRYSYVANNPLRYTDPTGHSKLANLFTDFRKANYKMGITSVSVGGYYGLGGEATYNFRTNTFCWGVGVGAGWNAGVQGHHWSVTDGSQAQYSWAMIWNTSTGSEEYIHARLSYPIAGGAYGTVSGDYYDAMSGNGYSANLDYGAPGGLASVGVGASSAEGPSYSLQVDGFGATYTPRSSRWDYAVTISMANYREEAKRAGAKSVGAYVVAVFATDLYLTGVGLLGEVLGTWTAMKDVYESAAAGRFGEATKRLVFNSLGRLIPCYGWWGGQSWGKAQDKEGLRTTNTRIEFSNKTHDFDFLHFGWVKNVWSPNTPGLPPGPFGRAYRLLGTIPFSVAGGLQAIGMLP